VRLQSHTLHLLDGLAAKRPSAPRSLITLPNIVEISVLLHLLNRRFQPKNNGRPGKGVFELTIKH
jgi:hypothetical protein